MLPLGPQFRFKLRAAINMANALALARLNGSTVVSGYPKTGTTYLSHLAERATGRTYIEGSMRLAWRPSVIHTHSRRVPAGAIFSYRPIEQVIPSFVAQRLHEAGPGFAERTRAGEPDAGDRARMVETARQLLAGTPRLPAPSAYYASVREKGGIIVNILDLADEGSSARGLLEQAWGIAPEQLAEAIAGAAQLSEQRKAGGHEFYNRPTDKVLKVLKSDTKLYQQILDEAERTRLVVECGANG